jgi:hypothetical protein
MHTLLCFHLKMLWHHFWCQYFPTSTLGVTKFRHKHWHQPFLVSNFDTDTDTDTDAGNFGVSGKSARHWLLWQTLLYTTLLALAAEANPDWILLKTCSISTLRSWTFRLDLPQPTAPSRMPYFVRSSPFLSILISQQYHCVLNARFEIVLGFPRNNTYVTVFL